MVYLTLLLSIQIIYAVPIPSGELALTTVLILIPIEYGKISEINNDWSLITCVLVLFSRIPVVLLILALNKSWHELKLSLILMKSLTCADDKQ